MQKTITSVRLWIVDRLFNCLDFFDVIPVENKYRLRFGTWKIQIFVETHKKSSSYKLSTLSLFFFLDVLWNYPRRLVTRCAAYKRFSETGKTEFQAARLYRNKSSLTIRPMLSFSSSLHISILVFSRVQFKTDCKEIFRHANGYKVAIFFTSSTNLNKVLFRRL